MKWAALPALLFAGHLTAATLEGFASLEANTLMPGPSSGHFIEAAETIELPFQGQPVQGFSAVISNSDGSYLVLSDNGYGSRENSIDFLLRIYCIAPDFRTTNGGSGTIAIDGYINLSDPHRHNLYRKAHSVEQPAVPYTPDESIFSGRLLTGGHFDPESFQRVADGSIWVGDELGPFLLHLNARGELLERPFHLQGLVAPDRPELTARALVAKPLIDPPGFTTEEPVIRRSKGFEGMAISPSGHMLYPMLEGALFAQPGQLNIYSFDLERRVFINPTALEPSYRYRLEPGATATGAFQLFTQTGGLVLERDSGHGKDSIHKKVYRIDFDRVDTDGYLVKREVADLMNIADPHDLNRDGQNTFDFPFHTPEGLLIMDKNTIGVINDNNYPFGQGRKGIAGTENTEFILLRVADLW